MSATVYSLHVRAPERRKIKKVVEAIRAGGVVLYPSDTGYALGCELSNKNAIQRIRDIRDIDAHKAMTFMCASLSNVAEFALVEDQTYRILRRLVPGPFTFVLPASKNVPRFAQDPKRRTTGLRVPDDPVCQALLEELDAPLISITAKDPESREGDHPELLVQHLARRVDVAITLDQYLFEGESTVLDMTDSGPAVLRAGAGLDRVAEFIDIDA